MNTTAAIATRNILEALDEDGFGTPTHLGKLLEVSYSQATRYFSGKSALRGEHVAKIARVLNRTPESLIGVNPNLTTNYMTVTEAARMVGYHPDTIRKAVSSGEMKSVQRGKGHHYRIREIDLTAWLAGAR